MSETYWAVIQAFNEPEDVMTGIAKFTDKSKLRPLKKELQERHNKANVYSALRKDLNTALKVYNELWASPFLSIRFNSVSISAISEEEDSWFKEILDGDCAEAMGDLHVYGFIPYCSGENLICRGRNGWQILDDMEDFIQNKTPEESGQIIGTHLDPYAGIGFSLEEAIESWREKGHMAVDGVDASKILLIESSDILEDKCFIDDPKNILLGFDNTSIKPPPIVMPNGQMGYICIGGCNGFFSCVEPNRENGYICQSCR